MPALLSQLICHELQTGIDGNRAGTGGNAEKVLLQTLHDAVARNRAFGSDGQDLAASSLASHRCMTAFCIYAKSLQEQAQSTGVADLGSIDDAAKFAEYASRIWCLIHNVSINRIWKPGFGYLDFYRNWQEGSLLSSAHEVHAMCEGSLKELPPSPITVVQDVASVLDPITQLHSAISYCIQQQDDDVVQSQVRLVASNWSTWLTSPVCHEYIIGLAKVGRVGTLAKTLNLIFIFTSLSGNYSLQGPCASLLRSMIELCQEYDAFYEDMAQNCNNVYARFSVWRNNVKELYNNVHIVDHSEVSYKLIQQELQSNPIASLLDACVLTLDVISVSEALVEQRYLRWHEFLALYCSYVEPGMLEERLARIVSGSGSLFEHLQMQEEDLMDLPEEEKLIIMVLRGEILSVIDHLSSFNVPGLVPHLLEVVSSSMVGNPDHQIHQIRNASFTSYSSDLLTSTPAHHWQKALDYALWSGQEGVPILLNTLPHLELNSSGIDHLSHMYELWRPLDTNGLIKASIQDCISLHGHKLFHRGLVVEGMRRLLQTSDYSSLEHYLVNLLEEWSMLVLRSEQKPGLGVREWMNSPILSLAEAFNTKHLFNWPSASAVSTKSESVLGRPAVTFLQILTLAPRISSLTTSFKEQRLEDVRTAALAIIFDEAAPTLLKFATFHLINPLLEDDSTCFFSSETVGKLACVFEECLDVVNRDYSKEGISGSENTIQFAIIKASCKAVCSTSIGVQGQSLQH
eukprot:TRINITY_DN1344_c1_g1_i1.p1 TRINITY_DN1344_c1_g1~~TRINITY_DN1344_c1_g1_i1.p1  ORF type:complete len:743 (+),score=90.25 TRINITY_DN1344_c1_g1_i1:36-2264(+)